MTMPATANPAASATVGAVLSQLDAQFSALAAGLASGQYTLWLGSAISRERVSDLGAVVVKVLEYLQKNRDLGAPNYPYRQALDQALELARLSPATRNKIDPLSPVATWPDLETIKHNLVLAYSQLLDVRVAGMPRDHLLWDAAEFTTTFSCVGLTPDCEHLCVAALAMERAVSNIATPNWDGLIEKAEEVLSDRGAIFQTCVRPDDLRAAPRPTRLIKFHGCADLAISNPAVFRDFLIASDSQITAWTNAPAYRAIKTCLVHLATTSRTLIVGMSAQDSNIKEIFSSAHGAMAWDWPCTPPANVVAGGNLSQAQLAILRVTYSEAYDAHMQDINEAALLKAYSKPALLSLFLHTFCSKLRAYAVLALSPRYAGPEQAKIEDGIKHLRNKVASHADGDRYQFMMRFLTIESFAFSLFTLGKVPTRLRYHPISTLPLDQSATDPNLATNGIRELAVAAGLLGIGDEAGYWEARAPDPVEPKEGCIRIHKSRGTTPVFLAANERAATQLFVDGHLSERDDAVLIYSSTPTSTFARSPRKNFGRTGHLGLRSIGMADLIDEVVTSSELLQNFRTSAGI